MNLETFRPLNDYCLLKVNQQFIYQLMSNQGDIIWIGQ